MNFKPLPDVEREICIRFGTARRRSGLTQSQTAHRLQISRDRIANIEACRVPLKFSVGDSFCSQFSISQTWLVFGEMPYTPYQLVGESAYHPKPRPGALFSEVIISHAPVFQARRRYAAAFRDLEERTDEAARAFQEAVEKVLQMVASSVPQHRHIEFLEDLVKLVRRFQDPGEKISGKINSGIDIVTPERNIAGVKSLWKQLRERLLKATKPRKKKAELARFLGVPAPRVSEWLSDDPANQVEPSGETALRLLHWVQEQEKLT